MKKKKGVILLLMSVMLVCFLGMGAVFCSEAKANRPGEAYTGYIDENGKLVRSYTGSGSFGGSYEKEKRAKTLSTVCYVFGGLTGIGLAATICLWRVKE